ncbi:hypothetical protein ACFYKX_11450 [Cytobacillus sp. FJAT-54145]|uniref:Uncharacterized protein n=1 Tax=Cytobacillus spartinae TaxID=3299023 RepID=A0ABW6KAE7_9BACI
MGTRPMWQSHCQSLLKSLHFLQKEAWDQSSEFSIFGLEKSESEQEEQE